jgi:low affinity Fe/Cu permease
MHASRTTQAFTRLANTASRAAGRGVTFALAAAVVVVWGVTGPLFGFSDTWQLVINTGTTIVTFLMVFLIQNSQNRDSAAIQVKLDEIIRHGNVRNSFIGIEHLTEEELDELRAKCEQRAQEARRRDLHENRKDVRRSKHKPRHTRKLAV